MPDSRPDYYPQLDTLRTIAAFGVINLHWLNTNYPSLFGLGYQSSAWGFGHYGVQLFFVLSGFLIGEILIKSKEKQPIFLVIRNFYVRRALRLFPIYYLFLVFLIIVRDEFVQQNIGWFLTYTANIRFYLAGGLVDIWSNHLWTLSVEEQFYLVFPFLIIFIPKKLEAAIPICFFAIAVLTKSLAPSGKPVGLLTLGQLDMLGAGVCLAIVKCRNPTLFLRVTESAGKVLMAILLALAIGLYYSDLVSLPRELYNLLVLISFTLLVADTARGFTGTLGKIFENPTLRYLGQISYGLYLYHKVVPLVLIIVFNRIGLRISNIYFYYVINLALLIAVAHLSWKWVESPILTIKKRFTYEKS